MEHIVQAGLAQHAHLQILGTVTLNQSVQEQKVTGANQAVAVAVTVIQVHAQPVLHPNNGTATQKQNALE